MGNTGIPFYSKIPYILNSVNSIGDRLAFNLLIFLEILCRLLDRTYRKVLRNIHRGGLPMYMRDKRIP